MNSFFACWCKFWEAKSYFNNFWVDVVKNGCSLLVHETLKSVYLKIEFIIWADFLNADSNAIFLVRLISYSLTFIWWGFTALQLYFLVSIQFGFQLTVNSQQSKKNKFSFSSIKGNLYAFSQVDRFLRSQFTCVFMEYT